MKNRFQYTHVISGSGWAAKYAARHEAATTVRRRSFRMSRTK
jgi:hypothetical protein